MRSLFTRPATFALLAVLGGAFLRFHRLSTVPPGLHYDFAANAIIASDIAFNGWREVFITAYTGKEALYFYTAGLLFKFVGASVFTLQLTAAIYGVLGIAACYFAARQLLAFLPQRGWVAALAAAILSFTFMHLVWSRYGERATTEPVVQGLAVGFLFRAFVLDRKRQTPASGILATPAANFAIAGLFTGLAAYTYLAARLFPIPVGIALGGYLISARRHSPADTVRGVVLFGLAAALVFAPLGLFFINHPEAFLVRASQLTPREGEFGLLMQGAIGALGMIFVSGEPYDRFNIPGRPIFDWWLGLFFAIGLAHVLYRLAKPNRQPGGASPRLPYGFLLAYTLTFLAPTALSVHDIYPSNVRSMGLLPLIAVFPALGIAFTLSLFRRFFRTAHYPIVVFATLLFGTITTYHAYFNQWATAPGLHYANDTDLLNAARWLNTIDTENADVYLSAIHYRHPTVAYAANQFESFRWLNGGQALAIPPRPAIYVFPHSAPPPEGWLAGWMPIAAPLGPDGTPDFRAYRFDSPPPLPNVLPASANFANIIELVGYQHVAPDTVDFKLRVLNAPDQPDYRLVADVVDSSGYHWAQAFNDAYFAEQWQAEEWILMRITLDLPVGMPPGDYKLLLTFFSASAKTTLPAITPEGNIAAYGIITAIAFPASAAQPLQTPLAMIGETNLIKVEPPPLTIRQGEPLPFALHWQLPAPATADAPFVIRLGDAILFSGSAANNTYPITQWQAGEIVIDRYAPRLPRDFAAGRYTLSVNDFGLGDVTVQAIERQTAAPAPQHRLSATFDDTLALIGYDLTGDRLVLYWHALRNTEVNFTRFVHVLDANGQIIAQADSAPQDGRYGTSLWQAGEYVADAVSLPLAGGEQIAVGWYVAESGQRLKAAGSDRILLQP